MSFEDRLKAHLEASIRLAPAGLQETCVEGVRFFWTTLSTPPAPLIYEAGIVVLLQGRKEGRLGDQTFTYDADNYLVLTLPLPFECGHHASPEEPLCGFFISIEREDLELIRK